MNTKQENEWLMLLKTVPYNIFELFFDDNPELRYLAGERLYLFGEQSIEKSPNADEVFKKETK